MQYFCTRKRENNPMRERSDKAEEIIGSMVKTKEKISSKDEVSTGPALFGMKIRGASRMNNYGVHVKPSRRLSCIRKKKRIEKRYTTKSLILAQDER